MSEFLFAADDGLERAMASLQTHRAVLALDGVGRIVAINQCYLRLTGFRRDELIGRPVWVLLDLGERCAGRLSALLDLPENGEAHLPELAHVTKAGRRFRVDARVFAVPDGDGQSGLSMVFARAEDSGGLIELRQFREQPPVVASPAAVPQTGLRLAPAAGQRREH
jgi:PAS domain S-box-containing protein